jgi:hypothetical protein
MIEIRSIQEISSLIKKASPSSLLLLDVDDTLITPVSSSFRPQKDGSLNLIDQLKNRKEKIKDFHLILGHWRLQRKVMLVESIWPQTLRFLLEKDVPVIGLTKMDTGSFGPIQSMEEWRLKELSQLELFFTRAINGISSMRLNISQEKYSAFKEGILFTGPFSKGETLSDFLKHTNFQPKEIFFIDDRRDYIKDVQQTVEGLGYDFKGIHYRATENLPGQTNPNIVKIQQHYLLNHQKWLEDDQVQTLIDSSLLISSL